MRGIWQVNWPLVNFHMKGFRYKPQSFNGRIVEIEKDKWFVPKFIEFQYGRLRNNNSAHVSVLKSLEQYGLTAYAEGDGRKLLLTNNISANIRDKVFQEFESKCAYCLSNISQDNYHVDHIIPTSSGGNSRITNLVASCTTCNAFKSDFDLQTFCKRRGFDFLAISERLTGLMKQLYSPFAGAKEQDKEKDKDKVKEKVNAVMPKPEKEKHLEFVWLLPEEYAKLKALIGLQTQVFIERLNGYIGQIGPAKASTKYVSHYHTILNWYRKDKAEGKFHGTNGGTGISEYAAIAKRAREAMGVSRTNLSPKGATSRGSRFAKCSS